MNRFQVRRATVDDLPQLRDLWQMEGFAVEDLEKQLTEHQVAHTPEGVVVAVIGFQTTEGQGRLHSEAIGWPDQADDLRTLLWRRIEGMARSLGVSRVWTTLEAPFWKSVGFKRLHEPLNLAPPAAWPAAPGPWLVFPLRGEGGDDEIAKHLAVLKAMSQAEHEQLMERAKWMKWIAMALMAAVFAAFSVWVVSYVRLRKRRPARGPREW